MIRITKQKECLGDKFNGVKSHVMNLKTNLTQIGVEFGPMTLSTPRKYLLYKR